MEDTGKRKRVPSTKYASSDWDTGLADEDATDLHGSSVHEELDVDESEANVKKVKHAPRQQTPLAAAAPVPRQPAPRVSPKQRRQQQLIAALAERGLQLRADSRLCDEYIQTGHVLGKCLKGHPRYSREQQLRFIVDTMDEMRFYFAHTKYAEYRENEISSELRYRGRWDGDEVSDTAKDYALEEWASRFRSLAEAANRPELPRSLVNRVLQLQWPIVPQDPEPESESESDPSSGPDWSYSGRRYRHERF